MQELNQAEDIKQLTEKVKEQNVYFSLLKKEINKAIIGQEYMVDRLLIGLLGNGHVLLEGVPGLAKTLAIKTLSEAVHGAFSRIQFTPDLLPADVIGTQIYNVKENDFSIKKGPVATPEIAWATPCSTFMEINTGTDGKSSISAIETP